MLSSLVVGGKRRKDSSGSIATNKVNIDLKAFKYLRIVDLNLNSLTPGDFERLLILFKYTDCDENHFCLRREKEDANNIENYVFAPATIEEIRDCEAENVAVRVVTVDKIEQLNLYYKMNHLLSLS